MDNRGHHLILGQLEDFITGRRLADTHDERDRQKIARLLVTEKGYLKRDIEPRRKMMVRAGERRAVVKIDFAVRLSGRICMIIRYGPGSIVTRRRPVLAASRVAAGYQIPVAIVTNGRDAEVLDAASGRVVSTGLGAIPSRSQLAEIAARADFAAISTARAEMESRLIYCYEVDGACPCDEDICRL